VNLRALGWIVVSAMLPLLVLGGACSRERESERTGDSPQEKVAYSSSVGGSWQIWVSPVDGGSPVQRTHSLEDVHYPAWSADGKKLAYTSNDGAVWIIEAGGEPRRLANLPSNCSHPAWSPDDSRLAVACSWLQDRKEFTNIWILNLRTNSVSELMDQGSAQKRQHPAWSPDGATIAYTNGYRVSASKIVEELWLVDSDGTNAKPLVVNGFFNLQPDWSPDGEWIAFASNQSGSMNIWMVDRSGTRLQQLTRGKSYDGDPSWSPDGSRLCFASTRSGTMQIWIADSSGANLRQLTGLSPSESHAESTEPHWARAGK
jgi:TolB protein